MKIKWISSFLFVFFISLIFAGCNVLNGTDAQITFNGDTAPTLNNLVITSTDSYSIILQQPTLSTAGTPAPTVNAYIGVNGVITASGSSISGSIQGPIDVSSGSYQFSSLNSGTSYKIIVVAENYKGYSTKQIIQSTAYIAPVLNNLVITGSGSSSITLQQPTFSTVGNPTPVVNAYIGINGTIAVSGSTVSNSIQGPIDVSSADYQFTGLDSLTDYQIVVISENNQGYSVKQIIQSTTGIAPVLNNVVVPSYDSLSITLQQPTFSTVGNPTPTVNAYIGIKGTITVNGSNVSNSIQGPVDVSSADYQFTGLTSNTNYKIIVVAQNNQGYSVKQIVQSTAGIAPVLNSLVISNHDSYSITLQHPTFSTAGNPTPTVNAYIGINGVITISGTTVTGSIQGPVDVSSGDYQFTGLDSNTNYKIIVVAQNSQGYSVKQIVQSTMPSSIATVTSTIYTVSVGGTAHETITGVHYGTSKVTVEAALTPGDSHQTWNDTGVHDPVLDGDTLVVTAQDGTTVVNYTFNVAYYLRDTGPSGGLIFYDKGSYSNGWRYLEAASIDQSSTQVWSNVWQTAVGSTGTAIGTGLSNTTDIIAQMMSPQNISFSYVPTAGLWTLSYNGNITNNMGFNADSAAVQAALRLLPGLSAVTVTGNYTVGVGFNVMMTGVPMPVLPLVAPANTLTSNSVPPQVSTITPTSAAYLCSIQTIDGFSDWFLPSEDELDKMYVNLHKGIDEHGVVYTPVGGFVDYPYYWSSSEFPPYNAWIQDFANSIHYASAKSSPYSVRCVRRF